MKKIIILVVIFIVLLLSFIYIYIPSQLQINETVRAACAQVSANRSLSDSTQWQHWWPGEKANGLTFEGVNYKPSFPASTGFRIFIDDKHETKESLLIILPGTDTTSINWSCSITTSKNPIIRVSEYFAAARLAKNMRDILEHLKTFLGKTENIYGLKIFPGKVTDTLLVSTFTTMSHYPSTEEVYALINKLRTALNKEHIDSSGYPMLNVSKPDIVNYVVRVAIPVHQAITETNDIRIKRMVPGNIMISENITGGPHSVSVAFKAMDAYVGDYQKTIPAIPFQSLITDRSVEADTSKWITKIYYPVY
ncbi:MAG TPA: hypothetical protein PKM63_06155 [Panacibacter sp.]|nr:hypothetical protein [Panacibacter sp.]HNP43849.1 hypothetical protein [Panacibacter sp.]